MATSLDGAITEMLRRVLDDRHHVNGEAAAHVALGQIQKCRSDWSTSALPPASGHVGAKIGTKHHSESAANLLIHKAANSAYFSECPLIVLRILPDFDSNVRSEDKHRSVHLKSSSRRLEEQFETVAGPRFEPTVRQVSELRRTIGDNIADMTGVGKGGSALPLPNPTAACRDKSLNRSGRSKVN